MYVSFTSVLFIENLIALSKSLFKCKTSQAFDNMFVKPYMSACLTQKTQDK